MAFYCLNSSIVKTIYLTALPVLLALLYFGTSSAPASAPENERAEAEVAKSEPVADSLIVLELFTSQGCSSCPPADALLEELAAEEGVLALSFHVDYWNYLGWADPFSSPYYSARQRTYTEQLRSRTYTPQLVVNGREEMIGSRRAEVTAALARARKTERTHELTLEATPTDGKVNLTYALEGTTAGHRVSALIVQHEATSDVNRGENRGRKLSHRNVVRALEHAPAAASGTLELTVPEGLDRGAYDLIVLVQNTTDRRITGAARYEVTAR